MPPAPLTPPRGTRAFTLIELLTVIAIIGVLAAILIPTVNKVRVSARSAQCVANLRQIGTAMQMHANDNKGLLPAGGNQIQLDGNKSGWAACLFRYVGTGSGGSSVINTRSTEARIRSVFVCPAGKVADEAAALPTADTPGGYGFFYGFWLSGKKQARTVTTVDGSETATVTFGNLSRITNPTRTVLVMDFAQSGTFTSSGLPTHLDAIGYRHDGRYNICWASGAVSALTAQPIIDSFASSHPFYRDYWLGGY